MFPQLRSDGGCKPGWAAAAQKDKISSRSQCLYPTDISVHLAGLSASQTPQFRPAVINHGIRPSLQNGFSYPQCQSNIFPMSCPCLFCQPFPCLLHLFPICQSPALIFHSEDLLKELGFGSVLNRTEQLAGCSPPCGRHFCPLSRLKYCDRLQEKWVIFQMCGRSCGAGEMTRTQAVQQEPTGTKQGSRASSLKPALRECLSWCARVCQFPKQSMDRMFNPWRTRS